MLRLVMPPGGDRPRRPVFRTLGLALQAILRGPGLLMFAEALTGVFGVASVCVRVGVRSGACADWCANASSCLNVHRKFRCQKKEPM